METLKGYIDHIIFSNAENGYTVFELMTDTGVETCVGILHGADEGENVELHGNYIEHSLYGRQFEVKEYEFVLASEEASIRRYLASGAVKGIGQSLANRIVDRFGEDTFKVMEEDPGLLAEIKGISMRKATEISEFFIGKQDLRRAMVFLQKFGVSNNLAMKIYAAYGSRVYEIMETNPYKLADDIDGVGFKIADNIASSIGIAVDSEYRINSGIIYVLQSCIAEGHVYLPRDIFLERATLLLGVDSEKIWMLTENLAMERKIIIRQKDDEVRVYSKTFYYMELNCAAYLRDLDIILDSDTNRVRKSIVAIDNERNGGTQLEEKQLEAVVTAVTNGVSVITGGPGTGKTTTINKLIKYLEAKGQNFLLAAPTGRAAKRMTEATGFEASTIQRMLGLGRAGQSEKGFSYEMDEDNPLQVSYVIIDEMSMVDLPLFYALLKAIRPGTGLVMVGDINQLPSVGPGSVLKDLIRSGQFKVVMLEKIYRQEGRSDIIVNAHKVNAGQMPKIDNDSKDFFFLKRDDVNVIMKNMVTLMTQKLPKYVNATSFDIQVLTPMRKGVLGVQNLNPILQKYINPPDPGKLEKEYQGTIFREGDKVMQIKNNYQLEWEIRGKYDIPIDTGLGVFNGDMGTVHKVDNYSEVVEVMYEENRIVKYPFSNLDELELAYAVTIHKSQGSEYPAVIIPLLSGPKPLLNRNLLYTAITRARRVVTILGSEDVLMQMVENEDEAKRYTGLCDAIREVMNADFG